MGYLLQFCCPHSVFSRSTTPVAKPLGVGNHEIRNPNRKRWPPLGSNVRIWNSAADNATGTEMTLIALLGQSNALGYLNDGPAPYAFSWRVQIWTDAGFQPLLPGWNTGTAANPHAWGPEVEFANEWLRDHADGTLYLVKVAKGSTGLAADPMQLDWSPESRGEMYDIATAKIHAAESALGAGLDGVLWMQGETDATDPTKAAHYAENLTDLAAHLRADVGADQIIIGRIGSAGAYSLQVRQAEWQVDQLDDRMTSFRTLDFGVRDDGLHYSTDGQIALGHAFYEGWAV